MNGDEERSRREAGEDEDDEEGDGSDAGDNEDEGSDEGHMPSTLIPLSHSVAHRLLQLNKF